MLTELFESPLRIQELRDGPPRPFRPLGRARVASLRCRILRPGEASINRAARSEKIKNAKTQQPLPERSQVE